MLHILLLILKIIGMILAVILGILVLLICIVLFTPVRYEVDGICKGNADTLKIKAKATWFFHLVRADIFFKEKKLRWRIRIAWKKITGGESFEKSEENEKCNEKEEIQETEKYQKAESNEKPPEKYKEDIKEQKESQKKCKEISENLEKEKTENKAKYEPDEDSSSSSSEKDGKSGIWIARIIEKIKHICCKIKCTIQNICDKIKTLSEKKEKLTEFVEKETHVKAFLKIKSEAFKIIKKLKPKEFNVKVLFGFDDPQRTGQVLAVLAVLYPFFEDNVFVSPDFERKILRGKLHLKGKVRCCNFVALACRIILCKNIRITYRDIKEFE